MIDIYSSEFKAELEKLGPPPRAEDLDATTPAVPRLAVRIEPDPT